MAPHTRGLRCMTCKIYFLDLTPCPKYHLYTISPVPLVHQLSLGVTKPHETVLLLDTADVDQPAPVQLALHQRLVPAVGSVREQVLVPRLVRVMYVLC